MSTKYTINNIRDFWGYYTLNDQMKQIPGVYVIFNGQSGSFVDVGQAENLNERLANHDRKPCWNKHCPDGIYLLAKVVSDADKRTRIEKTIRDNHPQMPCGDI